jgi:Methyltransferase domain
MTVRVSEGWLALREPADAAARATELVDRLPEATGHVIHDLGCGSGSMGRWLAPLLPGPQHWALHDRDPDLLEAAAARPPPGVSIETRQSDITRLEPRDLEGATLITASALLDMFTDDELARFVDACAGADCPALLTLSVVGRVELAPEDPLDGCIEAAFNSHQRRNGLLGPDAVRVAAERFRGARCEVIVRPSPWQLGAGEADLAAEWFGGWVGAACEQDPELDAEHYARKRLDQANAGRLAVTVHHADLLALPRSGR